MSAMREFMNITGALADETRLRILMALRDGELCVCQLTELFSLAPSTVSKHLSLLYQAGLVESRKEGRWIYYRSPGAQSPKMVRLALDWVADSTEKLPPVIADSKKLKRILKMDPSVLCKKQCGK